MTDRLILRIIIFFNLQTKMIILNTTTRLINGVTDAADMIVTAAVEEMIDRMMD